MHEQNKYCNIELIIRKYTDDAVIKKVLQEAARVFAPLLSLACNLKNMNKSNLKNMNKSNRC